MATTCSLLYKQKSHPGNYSKVIGVAHRPKQTGCFLLITESEFSIGRNRGANRQSFGMTFPFAGPRGQNINPKGCSSVLRSDGICPTKPKLPGTSALSLCRRRCLCILARPTTFGKYVTSLLAQAHSCRTLQSVHSHESDISRLEVY